MDSGEDDEIAQLRSTLLHSIRASKNRSSRGRNKHQEQIFDTDIDDLEALRLAALGTVKAGASVSGNGSPSTWQQPSTPLLRSTQNAQFPVAPPQYRPRFPFNNRLKLTAPRSNLIVLTHTEPKKESYNHNSNHLALPQQRLNGAPANRMLNESPAKRTDKWSRNRDSSDDDSDGEDEEEENGKEGSGSEDGDREERSGSASSASDGLQAAADDAEDDDTSRPALADGELIDIPDTVEDDDEGTASAAAPVKKSTSRNTSGEAETTGAAKSRRSTNRLPTMDEDELLLFDDDDDYLLLGADDVDEAAMRAAADALPQSDYDSDDKGPNDEPEVIVSDAPVREDAPSRDTKSQLQSRRRRRSPTPPGRSAGGYRRRSPGRDPGERRDKRKLESELATVEGRLKQIYSGGSKHSPAPSSSSNARRDRDGRREGGSSAKDHSRRPVGDRQRRRADEDRRRRSRSRSSHERSAGAQRPASRDDRHHRQPLPADGDDRKRRQQPTQRGDDRRAAERPKAATNAPTDRRREQPSTVERSKAPSTKSAHAGVKEEKARKREELPTLMLASAVVKTATSTLASIKGAGKGKPAKTAAATTPKPMPTMVPKTSARGTATQPASKMDLTSLIVTVPVLPSTTTQQQQQQPSQAKKSAKMVDLRQKLGVSTGSRKTTGSDDSAVGADAAPAGGRQSLSIKDRLAPIGQSRNSSTDAAPSKKKLESAAYAASKEVIAFAPGALGQLKKRIFSPIRPPVVASSSGAGEGIDSPNRASRSNTGLTTVSGVDEGVPKKLQRVGQASAKPPHQQQQQRRFIVSDDAPKLDDLLSKQVNGSHDTNAATKRRIRLNRPALQEA